MIKRRGYIPLDSYNNKFDNNGNKLCLNCGNIITKKRQRRYCSGDCRWAFMTKNDHNMLKTKLCKERNFTCADCKQKYRREYELILDHIKPIAIGGAEFDENNLQVLCIECNKIKTKEDMKQIAIQRRIEKNQSKGQESL